MVAAATAETTLQDVEAEAVEVEADIRVAAEVVETGPEEAARASIRSPISICMTWPV